MILEMYIWIWYKLPHFIVFVKKLLWPCNISVCAADGAPSAQSLIRAVNLQYKNIWLSSKSFMIAWKRVNTDQMTHSVITNEITVNLWTNITAGQMCILSVHCVLSASACQLSVTSRRNFFR
jgi:hypothetical protein